MSARRKPDYHPGRWIFAFAAIAVVGAMMLFYFYAYPHRLIGPAQPIPFSHRVHAGTKQIACRFCHPFAEYGPRAGLPTMRKCFFCHEYIIPRHPEILKEKMTLQTGKPIEWVRVFYLPDYVQFNHQPHIAWAGFECRQCHGAVEAQDRLFRTRFKMGFCIDCHRAQGAQIDCWLACHH